MSATDHSREWVMGQMGHENWMGHMCHGSLTRCWPMTHQFFNSMAGLIYCGNNNISCQSVMHVQLCMWLTKFQVHVHIQVPASRAATYKTYKTAKINFITSWAKDIICSSYYILSPWCDEINFCCFICVTQRWALHVVIKRQFFFTFYVV